MIGILLSKSRRGPFQASKKRNKHEANLALWRVKLMGLHCKVQDSLGGHYFVWGVSLCVWGQYSILYVFLPLFLCQLVRLVLAKFGHC
jgi:hypothetical protein